MAMIKIFTAICIFILQAESQNQYPTQANFQIQNPDQIYFADTPRIQINRNTGQYETVRPTEVDSYLQGIQGNANFGQNGNQIPNQNPRRPTSVSIEQSIDLSPPPFANTENYYANVPVGLSTSHGGIEDSVVTKPNFQVDNDDSVPNEPQVNEVSRAITNFGINIMKTVSRIQPGNTVVSPYSIANLLAVLQQGANGETLQQITNALQIIPAQSAQAYKGLTSDINKRNSRTVLKTANNIFLADSFDLNRAFKNIAIQNFGSDVTPTNFGKGGRAVQDINSWVASKTNNKITKLLSANQISEATQMVLVNTVFFKGQWELKFRPEATKPQEFKLSNGGSKTTQFMQAQRHYRYGVDEKSQVIVLPFEGDYSLVVILPSEDSNVDNVLSTLTDAKLAKYQKLPSKEVKIEMPKFTVRADTNLHPILKQMGVSNIFEQHADLVNIGSYRSQSPFISAAVHSAMMSIDEEGGTAAASTAFAAVALSYEHPTPMKVNRPFLAVIWDQKLSIPFFIAKIEDPIF